MGRQASESIIFAATDTVIVEADEIVSREHYAILNTVAQDALDALELEIHQREAEALKPAALEAAAKSPDFEGDIQHVREELQEKTTIIRSHYDDLREELLSLSERQFFNEQRYRELRQRWGQVFRAGMGAEAIHELLSNLDLDAMAEELWHEVRFGRSAQRRKKATRQLRVAKLCARATISPNG